MFSTRSRNSYATYLKSMEGQVGNLPESDVLHQVEGQAGHIPEGDVLHQTE
jgi:hypothetical protein